MDNNKLKKFLKLFTWRGIRSSAIEDKIYQFFSIAKLMKNVIKNKFSEKNNYQK